MTQPGEPSARVRDLIRTRQYREFTPDPPADEQLQALLDVARWTGSSRNSQPWRFVLVRDVDVIRRLADAGMPLTRSLRSATAAIAIVLPVDTERATSLAFDEGRVAERILVGASMLGLGAGVAWVHGDARALALQLLGVPDGWLIRTIVSLGRPSDAARAPKSAPGTARLPRDQVAFEERWPAG